MRKLWFHLALSFTPLSYIALISLFISLFLISDYKDFHRALTLDNVEKRVASEKLTAGQFINDPENTEWRDKLLSELREKLMNIEHGSGVELYHISNSSRPEVFIQITDHNGNLLLSDPADLPIDIKNEFSLQKTLPGSASVKWLSENGPVWIDMPVTDSKEGTLGQLRVLYIAEFDPWVQFKTLLAFLRKAGLPLFFFCIPIGLVCGIVASRYVTRQLQGMNEITESWRQGNFEPRIMLESDDVLIRHSQHLNDMAHDLEMYLDLKENLAVSDERNRVARELHDTVKQKLFALNLQLATAKSKPTMEDAREHILEAETITREAQYDLMEIITQLRPTGSGDSSLNARIAMIAEDFKRRFGVNIELSNSGPTPFNAHTEHHVLRIVQESLMNAVRHGKATNIVITSKADKSGMTLTISDNGDGFDTEKKTPGFGLVSMRDRVSSLSQGKLYIKSAAGAGTEITLTWNNEA